jgi:hypothetical protein
VKAKRAARADQRFVLVSVRTHTTKPSSTLNRKPASNRKPARFTLAVAGTAVAMAATVAAAAALFAASTAAQPASAVSMIRPASIAAMAPQAGTVAGTIGASTATLDGFARPLLMAARHRTARQIAWRMLTRKHWSASYQYPYLRRLWDRESSWNIHAENPYSGAYGIPQAVPGAKMSSAGPDWENSARTQVRWGLDYIRDRYNSPRRAWLNEEAFGWY